MTHPKNILKQDVLQAYEELGGIDYLRRQPKLLQAILLKILNRPDPSPTLIIDMSSYAPWLNWRERLSYKHIEHSTSASSDAPSVTDVEAKMLPIIEEAKPWKELPEDGLAKTMRDYGTD